MALNHDDQFNIVFESGERRAYKSIIPAVEVALLTIFVVVPFLVSEFWILFGTKIFILGLLALSFDLVWGYAGIMSFGQALFFGVSGYAAALIATKLEITSLVILLPAAALLGWGCHWWSLRF